MIVAHVTRTALATLAALVAASAGQAFASFSHATSAAGSVSTLALVAPASAGATATSGPSGTCSTVHVTWSAAVSANDYEIELRTSTGGTWNVAATSTGNVTSWTDSAGQIGPAVSYRVRGRNARSGWTSTAATVTAATLDCVPSAPTAVGVTNPGSDDVVTWTASGGATGYTVEAEVGTGSWTTVATGVTGTSYTDSTQYTVGSTVNYRITATAAGVSSAVSPTASVSSWSSFYVSAIVFSNTGTHDKVELTFSKAVTTASVSTSLDFDGTAISFGSNTDGTAGIGRLVLNATTGDVGSFAGTVTWNAADTVMTWTASKTGVHTGTDTLVSWTAGTGTLCAADSSKLVSTPAPTFSGSW